MTFHRLVIAVGVGFLAAAVGFRFGPAVGCLFAGLVFVAFGVLFEDW